MYNHTYDKFFSTSIQQGIFSFIYEMIVYLYNIRLMRWSFLRILKAFNCSFDILSRCYHKNVDNVVRGGLKGRAGLRSRTLRPKLKRTTHKTSTFSHKDLLAQPTLTVVWYLILNWEKDMSKNATKTYLNSLR